MTPEQKARVNIDALLVAAGWHVCEEADANLHVGDGVDVDHGVTAQDARQAQQSISNLITGTVEAGRPYCKAVGSREKFAEYVPSWI